MDNLMGKILGNRYLLIEKIGEGGMALVYKAKCQLLNRYVAVKLLRPEFTADEEFVKKFKRESLAAASLSHPNIVGIYDVGEQDGIYYIVMEYISGQTLKEYIRENNVLDYKETLKICYQITKALENAHKNGVVHRDIKPHNILITEDKIVKVTDFGIARASTSTTMTNTGKVMGSVHYFSPEQARGGYSDHRTDIYSIGVVMYEMLTGKLPYDAESPITVALKHIQDNIVEPKMINNNIPKAVNDIVVKAMEKDMSKRYQSAGELLDDIARAQENPDIPLINKQADNEQTRVIPVEEIDRALGARKENEKHNKKRDLESDETKGKRKKVKKLPLILTALLIVFLSGVGVLAYNRYFTVKEVKVPMVLGLNENDARKLLEDNRLYMEVINRENSDKPEGQVLNAYPETGTIVKENSVIKVTVSAGQKKSSVPDLYKLDISTADTLLENSGLKRGDIERRYSNDVPKDLIIAQDPDPNTEVKQGTTVNIVLSDGPEIKFVTVPVLTGKTIKEAQSTLKGYKLSVGTIKYSTDNKFIDGVVIDQGVSAGTQVKQGTTIDITINKLEDIQDNSQNQDGTNGGQDNTNNNTSNIPNNDQNNSKNNNGQTNNSTNTQGSNGNNQ